MRIKRQSSKNLVRRIYGSLIALGLAILLDEYLKEGYFFNVYDITHEALLLSTILFATGLFIGERLKM